MNDKAEAEYTNIINNAWDYYNNGENINKALKEVKKCIEKYPQKGGGYYLMGLIEFDKKNYVKAVEFLKNALEFDSENKAGGFIHYFLGKSYNEKSKEWFTDFIDNPIYNFDMAKFSFEKSFEYKDFPSETINELIKIYKKDHYRMVNILKKAITCFPENIDFILQYSNSLSEIKRNEDSYRIISVNANKLQSSSLYYKAGILLYNSEDFSNARLNFVKAKELLDKDKAASISILNYQIANSYYKERILGEALNYFRESFDLIIEENAKDIQYINIDFWFSAFGIISILGELNKIDDLKDFVSIIPFVKDSFESFDYSGDFFLDSSYRFSIDYDFYNEKCIEALDSLSKENKNNTVLGKINWIKFLIYKEQSNQEKCLNALRETIKYDVTIDNYLFEALSQSYYYCINDKISEKKEYGDLVKSLILDLEDNNTFRNNFDEYYLNEVIDWLFSDKNYQVIIDLKKNFTSVKLDKSDSWFEIAYSYNEIGDKKNAQKSYEHYLTKNKNSTAALNNLANIYHEKKELIFVEKAIKLYEKAIKIDSDKDLYIKNLSSTKETREELIKEKSTNEILEKTFKRAIGLLKNENHFSLESLYNFILNLKRDDDFQNNQMPIEDDYFPSLMNTNYSKSKKLKEAWLSKNYIINTEVYDDHHVPIYMVNPYLHDAIIQQRKIISENDIPPKWLEGIEGLSVSKLEEIQYFNIIEKIGKINKKFKPIIERDFNELVFNHLVGNIKSTIVLSGSFVELILTYHLERKKHFQIQYSNSKQKNLYDCNLFDLISFSEEKGFFGKDFFHLTNLSRVYRNFIHPGLELQNELNKGKSDLCFISTMEIFKLI